MKDRNTNFQEHSIFLSEIAMEILKGNNRVFEVPGVSEIISLYLLVPYITNNQLDVGMPSNMPKLDSSDNFSDRIKLKDLRDTICHSFVTVEESTSIKKGRIIIDDRSIMNRNNHNNQQVKTKNVCIEIDYANDKLRELHSRVINTFNSDTDS